MLDTKTFTKADEGKLVEVTYADTGRTVRGPILSIWQDGYRVDIKDLLDNEGAYRIEWGVPSNDVREISNAVRNS